VVTSLEYALWLDFVLFLVTLALFVYVFMSSTITRLHKVYLTFHACLLLWPFSQFAVATTDDPFFQAFHLKIGFAGISVVGVAWTIFAIFLSGHSYILNRRSMTALAIPTVVVVVLILLNPSGTFMKPVDSDYADRVYGPIFWAMIAIQFVYLALSTAQLVRNIRDNTAPRHRRQIRMALTGMFILFVFALADTIVNVVFDDRFPTVSGLTSFGIMFSVIYFVIAIRKYGVFDIVRIAQVNVVDSMSTGVAVLDEHDVVLETNRVFRRLFDIRTGDRLRIESLLEKVEAEGGIEPFLQAYRGQPPKSAQIEVTFKDNDSFRHVIIHGEPIEANGAMIGRVLTFQDVSELRSLVESSYRQNEALQQRNRELVEMQAELYAMNQQLERMAITDSLTGCYNRRYLMQQLEHEIMTNIRYNIPFAIFLFDIDLFKSINDVYGHLVGDEVIKHTADTVRRCLRRTDIVARYGGEEFTVYLPHTNRAQAMMLAERVRQAVSSTEVPAGQDGRTVTVTISMGVLAVEESDPARIDDAKEYLRELFSRVDAALYKAKNGGRNRIVAAD
jgi:diguanylate cyclase (GGDEF)-like protein